jgi:DNA-binding response OmpR family regulator
MHCVLVIAPDLDLRRSLQFALEAEGYSVTWRTSVAAMTALPQDFDCTVVDHHALGNDKSVAQTFLRAFEPAILLANKPHELSTHAFRTILKPHLGAALTLAIREAIDTRGATT